MAAAASLRLLLQVLPNFQTTNKINNNNINPSLLSFSTVNLFESRTLSLKAALKPSHLHPRLLAFSSFASYTGEETDDDRHQEDEEAEFAESRTASSPPEEAGRLYVGNLPYSMTSSELVEIFSQAGNVKTAEIVYDRVTDRSRGFAFVTMANIDDANNAIRLLNGSQVGGRTVRVNFPEVPRGGEREVMGPRTKASRGYLDSPYKVYAGNLGWTVTSESLKDVFADQPGLLGAKVIYERDSGRSRGFGFVSFGSAEEAQSAIENLNGKEVQGRPLRLNLASQRSTAPAAV